MGISHRRYIILADANNIMNDDQHYFSVLRQIDLSPTIGGPPIFEDDLNPETTLENVGDIAVPMSTINIDTESVFTSGNKNVDSIVGCTISASATAVTGCTGTDFTLYNQVQKSIDCVVASEGTNLQLGSLAYAINLPTTQPVSCMLDLVTGPYSKCGSSIPDDKKQAAYDAFSEITGYRPIDLNHIFDNLNEEQKTILAFNSFYIFVPLLIILLIAVWLMVGFGWFNWVIGIYLTISAILVIYIFSVAYRLHVQNFLDSRVNQVKSDADAAQNNFQNSIAYWPQGLFAAACAVMATGTTGWRCNDSPDSNLVSTINTVKVHRKKKSCCGCKSSPLTEDKEEKKRQLLQQGKK